VVFCSLAVKVKKSASEAIAPRIGEDDVFTISNLRLGNYRETDRDHVFDGLFSDGPNPVAVGQDDGVTHLAPCIADVFVAFGHDIDNLDSGTTMVRG